MYVATCIYDVLMQQHSLLCLFSASANVEADEELSPFTEEDLSLMYVNPQLVANQEFVENFMRVSINKM